MDRAGRSFHGVASLSTTNLRPRNILEGDKPMPDIDWSFFSSGIEKRVLVVPNHCNLLPDGYYDVHDRVSSIP